MRSALLFLALAISAPVWGQTLGVHGNTYAIQEENGADYLKRRVQGFKDDGTLSKKIATAQANAKNKIYNPSPIEGVSKATESQTFWFDPTIVTDKPIVDGKGRILYPAGIKVNPLQYSGLSSHYIFIDARDDAQVNFALEHQRSSKDKVVLVGGSWVNLSRKVGHQVYYDQSGYLTKHFGIKHVPAILVQDGLKLKIEEFAL